MPSLGIDEVDMFSKENIDFYSLQKKAILKKIDNLHPHQA